jgi:hypothetical protein
VIKARHHRANWRFDGAKLSYRVAIDAGSQDAVIELAQMPGELGRIEDAKPVLREHVNSSLGARSLVKPARLSATKIVVVTGSSGRSPRAPDRSRAGWRL